LVWWVRFRIVYWSVDRVEDAWGFVDPAAFASCDFDEVAAFDKRFDGGVSVGRVTPRCVSTRAALTTGVEKWFHADEIEDDIRLASRN